jgi:shikimate dehydrogenase
MADVNPRASCSVGAGVRGAAVGYAMLKSGTQELSVHDTDRSRAVALAERMSGLFEDRKVSVCDDVRAALASADGLVHATTDRHAEDILEYRCRQSVCSHRLWVRRDRLRTAAHRASAHGRQHGCRTLDGDGMACFQGAMAFKLFFDVNPDVARMQRRFHSKLATAAA